jgi:competence protein ComFC
MKCLVCENFTLSHICKGCQKQFLRPSLFKRQLNNGIDVYSFYRYNEIKPFLFTKHTELGFMVYKRLAQSSFAKFAQEFHLQKHFASVAIDDTPLKSGYSHTAILNKALKSSHITPRYNILRAKSTLSYSKKSKAFRLNNPRNFHYNDFKEEDVIVVDDIITTGTTLQEACSVLHKHHKKVAFCLTLSDVSLK